MWGGFAKAPERCFPSLAVPKGKTGLAINALSVARVRINGTLKSNYSFEYTPNITNHNLGSTMFFVVLLSSLLMPLEIQSLIAIFVTIGLTPLALGKILASDT